jgi:type IV fimbrial biogenesis protein FimT
MGSMRRDHVNASMPFSANGAGFGLIEQIVALMVLAVLAAIAVPSFAHMLDRQALTAAQNDYITALLHARYLAVNDQAGIVFCPSSDGQTCSNGNAWSDGWLIASDPDHKPLYVGGKYAKRLRVVSTSSQNIRLQPDGTTGTSNQTLTICLHHDTSHALSVVIARRGRVRGEVASAANAAKCAALD